MKFKRTISIILVCVLTVAMFCACSSKENDGHEQHSMQIWKNANCQAPKTCGICGYTEGEKGDHSAKIGTCLYCNEYQGKEILDDVKAKLQSVSTSMNAVYSFLEEKKNNLSVAVPIIVPDVSESKATVESIISICKQYQELSDIQRQLETAVSYFPSDLITESDEEVTAYAENVRMYTLYLLEAYNYTQFIS